MCRRSPLGHRPVSDTHTPWGAGLAAGASGHRPTSLVPLDKGAGEQHLSSPVWGSCLRVVTRSRMGPEVTKSPFHYSESGWFPSWFTRGPFYGLQDALPLPCSAHKSAPGRHSSLCSPRAGTPPSSCQQFTENVNELRTGSPLPCADRPQGFGDDSKMLPPPSSPERKPRGQALPRASWVC